MILWSPENTKIQWNRWNIPEHRTHSWILKKGDPPLLSAVECRVWYPVALWGLPWVTEPELSDLHHRKFLKLRCALGGMVMADTIIFRTPVFARTDRFATATLCWPRYDVILIDPIGDLSFSSLYKYLCLVSNSHWRITGTSVVQHIGRIDPTFAAFAIQPMHSTLPGHNQKKSIYSWFWWLLSYSKAVSTLSWHQIVSRRPVNTHLVWHVRQPIL